jgi:hypothetical protein
LANGGNTAAYGYRGKPAAAAKRTAAYAGNAVGNGYRGKPGAGPKRSVANAGNAIMYNHCGNSSTISPWGGTYTANEGIVGHIARTANGKRVAGRNSAKGGGNIGSVGAANLPLLHHLRLCRNRNKKGAK